MNLPTLLSWEALLQTVRVRPYVLAFLLSFLIIGFLNRGWRNTLIFLGLGLSLAYLSEFASIRWGFPYGIYHYRYENLPGELLLWGVPLWDSLSYSFLAYAAYEYGGWLLGKPSGWSGAGIRCLLSAFLMTAIDVVVDPLAVRGGRWFLGDIFYYPNGGAYFGVPLTNFAGWFLVALAIIGTYSLVTRGAIFVRAGGHALPLGPLFYWGVLIFNWAITIYLQEWKLLLCGLTLHLTTMSLLILCRHRRAAD